MNIVFKALNDETRRTILEMLRKKDMSVGEIAKEFDMSQPSISHHLDILRQATLVESGKKGQYIMYSLNASVLDDIVKWMFHISKKKK